MARPAPRRLHRLPQWSDYILVPAPLDLSLTEVAGKSPLPAIIVTPSSPSSTRDFSLAFLPNPNVNVNNKQASSSSSSSSSSDRSFFHFRIRYLFCILILIFVFVCHLLTYRTAVGHHHHHHQAARLDFAVEAGEEYVPSQSGILNWLEVWPKFDDAGGKVNNNNNESLDDGQPPTTSQEEYVPFDNEVLE